MGIRIMHKPYHLVAYDNGTEVWRCTVNPPPLAGLNKDNKSMKNDKGQWIRVFDVTDAGDSPLTVGEDVVTYQTVGEFPEGTHEDLTLRVELIPGLRAKKQRRNKPAATTPTVPDGVKLKPVTTAADEATDEQKEEAAQEAVENATTDEPITATEV